MLVLVLVLVLVLEAVGCACVLLQPLGKQHRHFELVATTQC